MVLPISQILLGSPVSNTHQPNPIELAQYLQALFLNLTGANAGALIQTSKTALDGLSPAANTMAWVIGDTDPDLDGVYQYASGSWVKRAPLPYSVVLLNNAGTGTPNAIEVTTAIGIPSAAYGTLFLLNITAANTGAVTVSINGGAPRPVVTNVGSPLPAGYFAAGLGVLAIDDGTNLRLLTPGDVESLLAQVEALRDETVAAASSVTSKLVSRAFAQASYNPIAAPAFIETAGYSEAGDLGGALYAANGTTSGDLFITLDDGVTLAGYDLVERTLRFQMFGAKGDASTLDSTAVTAAIATGKVIDGLGLTYAVSAIPAEFKNIRNAAFLVDGIRYPTDDFRNVKLFQVTRTPQYTAWTENKVFTIGNTQYIPCILSYGHNDPKARIAMVRSYDMGETYESPEILFEATSTYAVNSFCAGEINGRIVFVVEHRDLSTWTVIDLTMRDRISDKSARAEIIGAHMTVEAGSPLVSVYWPKHGLVAGEKVSFSGVQGSGLAGMSGELTVDSITDADHFVVDKGSNASSAVTEGGGNFYIATAFHANDWRITTMPTFPNGGGGNLSHVHSFATYDEEAGEIIFGFHNGSAGGRELGFIYVEDFFTSTPTFTKKLVPSDIARSQSEPSFRVRVLSGGTKRIYCVTRSESNTYDPDNNQYGFSKAGFTDDLGENWTFYELPGELSFGPLPFVFYEDRILIFGSERSEGEWGTDAYTRFNQNFARSFMLDMPIAEFEAGDFSNLTVTWLCALLQVGELASTANGVGSVLIQGDSVFYYFGGESSKLTNYYSLNFPGVDDEYLTGGYAPDIFCARIDFKEPKRRVTPFEVRCPDNRHLAVYTNNGEHRIDGPIRFQKDIVGAITATFSEVVAGQSSLAVGLRAITTPVTLSSNVDGTLTLPAGYSRYYVDTSGGASAGDCIAINRPNSELGDIIVLSSQSSARDVTFNDTAAGGNLRLAGDLTLLGVDYRLTLEFSGTNWVEVSRSAN